MTAIPSTAVILDGSFCQYCSTTPRLTRSSRSEHHVSKLRDCTARSMTLIRLTSAHPCKPLNYLHAYNCQPSRTLGWNRFFFGTIVRSRGITIINGRELCPSSKTELAHYYTIPSFPLKLRSTLIYDLFSALLVPSQTRVPPSRLVCLAHLAGADTRQRRVRGFDPHHAPNNKQTGPPVSSPPATGRWFLLLLLVV